MNQKVEVIPYDLNWPELFEKEAELIKKALEGNCIEIFHIGSTAVPGLACQFYRCLGYANMPFNDQSEYEFDPRTVEIGKLLIEE